MKRLGALAIVTLACLAIFGSTALAARPAAGFAARANHAAQGGALHITAKVKHPVRGTAFSASAVVHFASGDVSVALKKHGHAFNAGGRAAVAADEAIGPVAVDVTINYGATTQTLTVQGVVGPPDDD